MDIVKAFTTNNLNISIQIIGPYEKPLFRASDIGLVLGLSNVHASVHEFDDDQKVLNTIDTLGGAQEVLFLTESGLYELLFKSRKPIAKEFRKWICEVIKEIRLTGEYKLRQTIDQKDAILKQIENENEQLLAENLRLSQTDGKPIIYIFNTDARNSVTKPPLKIGATEKYRERSKPFKQTHPHGKMVFSIEVPSTSLCLRTTERWIHSILKPFNVANEIFDISVEEAKMIIIREINSMLLCSESNNDERLLKLRKLLDYETNIIHNTPIPGISTRCISTQTENESNENVLITYDSNNVKSKFQNYINECCIVRDDLEVSSVDMVGYYRIWSQNADKETYHALLDYLKERFKPIRLSKQDKKQVVNGFRGVSLKEIHYEKSLVPSDEETFIYHMCKFSPSGKVLFSDLSKEFTLWKQRVNKPKREDDDKVLKAYLKNCKYVMFNNIWTVNGNGQGYYGIVLKSEENEHRKESSTAKKVEKRDNTTHEVLDIWTTIAKAAEAEGISATKMSRSIKNKCVFESYYYCIAT